MDTQLRDRIDNCKFCQPAIREIAALLPAADGELHTLIADIVAARDPWSFAILVTAALDAGRRVDAEHLAGGAALAGIPDRLGNFALKMDGDVPGALLAAVRGATLVRQTHAAALFIAAAWCMEKRGGQLPTDFASEARRFARLKNLKNDALIYLQAAALTAKDEALLSVLLHNYPLLKDEGVATSAATFAARSLEVFASPVMTLVPETPPKKLAQGRTMRRAVEKLSRNELCHCGSGRKYKRCCFEKDQERLRFSSEVEGRTRAELFAEPETGLTEPRMNAMVTFEIERLDPRKIPEHLRHPYLVRIAALKLLDRAVEFLEVTDWNEERKNQWGFVLFFVMWRQRKDLAERMVALHTRHEPIEDLRPGVRLLLARDNPAEELRELADTAMKMLAETDPDKLSSLGHGILCSRHTALGILIGRSLIAMLPRKQAGFQLQEILEARDTLNLPPDDPFSDLLERRLAEETHDEGADAAALRAARKRLDAKAAEVRDLTEKIERQRRELDRREKPQKAAPQLAPQAPMGDGEVREMRIKLDRLKGALHERSAERTALRRELEKARDDLEALRQDQPGPASATESAADDEAVHYLPEQPAGNQPLRLIEFPHKFRETLEDLPRHAARAALAMIGRLAGGEPAAFAGVVQLKACHGILRQRIGSEHRLLFRLHPDRVQVLDLINRRDLDRKIKVLRAAG